MRSPEVGLRVIAIRTEGLGNSSDLLAHAGVGVLVDLQRDIDRFESLIEAEDVEPRLVLLKHDEARVQQHNHASADDRCPLKIPQGMAPNGAPTASGVRNLDIVIS